MNCATEHGGAPAHSTSLPIVHSPAAPVGSGVGRIRFGSVAWQSPS